MPMHPPAVRKIYLDAGFKIVNIIDYDNGNSMVLYELEVYEGGEKCEELSKPLPI